MGKYRRYKNRVEMFLSSERGKRVLNFCYSWGASIVILGALFKLLHLPYANQILFVAMIVESLVFAVSAFERPSHEYNWEDVFPVLKSKNPLDRPEFSKKSISSLVKGEEDDTQGAPVMVGGIAGQGTPAGGLGIATGEVSAGETKDLSESIKKLNGAAEQISKMADLTEATQKYLEQLSGMAQNMEKFSQITTSLTDVSDGINQHSQGYVQQMEMLNRNITGLNTIYELQLKGVSSQIDSIENINAGLNRIRDLYNGSVIDSSVFRSETEKMAQQLTQLNQVYSRLLQAMTVNMYAGAAPAPNPYQQAQPQQPQAQPQPQPVYQQQPPLQGNPYQNPYNNQQG
ncbi:MAG: gliding motility protein GldL [Tannerellaceae bacterium]|nr:gliding motility protein GldL [Tannerellaceae bacterium]